ncbi:nuclease-related domain-containing protein [Paraburkholderia gardini]|uniref:nuclease-related domain-containing protein n=1 Tax=Paraburkholderia gardini TaxID=2823469 RepID=UPI001E16C46C|nr:nuclease-related domain-containing protein [Paraburkholderia gardini]CAG4914175.1 hypothetical protein R69919_04175 [Paraburkholderia gardini]
MHTFLFFVALAVLAWRAIRRNRHSRTIGAPTPRTRSQAAGEAGEAVVHTALQRALQWLCGDNFYVHPTPILLHHAPGSPFPTAEVDHLVITPFGLFVIETKNWSGAIEPGPNPDTVVRIAADGSYEIRRSPIAQNRSKVQFLRAVLPGMWTVEGIGVFANEHCAISPALPLGLIRTADLSQWMRAVKTRHEKSGAVAVDVKAAWKAIQSVAETDPNAAAMEEHRRRVSIHPGVFGRNF